MLEYDEEMIDQYMGVLQHLKTLLWIKDELGDNVDITDRYIGYCSCYDSETTFVRSGISVILGLTDEQETLIEVEYHDFDEFEKIYPGVLHSERSDEVTQIVIPLVYEEQCKAVIESFSDERFTYSKIDDKTAQICYFTNEWPCYEDILEFLVQVRKETLVKGEAEA